jgi:hypothetical protein
MDKKEINDIVKKIKKYHYLGCGTKKCKFLASSNNKSEAKEELIDILEPDWDDLIDTVIYLITIRKAVKGDWDKSENKLIPSPIYMEINEYIINPDNKLKLTTSGINNQVYFTEEYLKKNDGIKEEDIAKSVYKFIKGELKQGLMQKNFL